MTEARRRKYKRTSPETWAIIKAAYLQGFTAVALGRRYGLNPGAIHRKACYEGWTEGLPSRRGRRAPPGDIEALPDAPGDEALDRLPDPVEPEPPPPRPGPAIDKGRLAASALEGAAALLAEGRLEAAAAYMKLADMGSRVGERAPMAAPTPEQARRWEAAHDFYTGQDPEARDLPVREQWRVLLLLVRHGRERAHVLDALRRERRSGRACACKLCVVVEATAPGRTIEGVGFTPATEAEAVSYLSYGAGGFGAGPEPEAGAGGGG